MILVGLRASGLIQSTSWAGTEDPSGSATIIGRFAGSLNCEAIFVFVKSRGGVTDPADAVVPRPGLVIGLLGTAIASGSIVGRTGRFPMCPIVDAAMTAVNL